MSKAITPELQALAIEYGCLYGESPRKLIIGLLGLTSIGMIGSRSKICPTPRAALEWCNYNGVNFEAMTHYLYRCGYPVNNA